MHLEKTTPDLKHLLSLAVAWAERQSEIIQNSGSPLSLPELDLARRMGVVKPEEIRLQIVEEIPTPTNSTLSKFADSLGLLDRRMAGLTLGYSIFILKGKRSNRIISHECRHVFQYEQAGSMQMFIEEYISQLIQFGYANSPFEQDAYAHETDI